MYAKKWGIIINTLNTWKKIYIIFYIEHNFLSLLCLFCTFFYGPQFRIIYEYTWKYIEKFDKFMSKDKVEYCI